MNSLPTEKKSHSFLRAPNPRAARAAYDRESQLPKLLGLWPSELQDFSLPGTARIVARLRKSIRSERQRAQSGHWSYDLNRHLALAEALKAERTRLRDLEAAETTSPSIRSKGLSRSRGRLHLAPVSAACGR